MKKLLAIALALVMVLSLSVTAFAADTSINQDTDPKTGTTNVTYTVNPTYTVTIPATVTLGGAAVEVKAENVVVDKGKQVVVKLTGTSDSGNAFKVTTTEGAELTYTVKKDGSAVALNDAVLTVNPTSGASGSVNLSFALAGTITYAGEYSGTVTLNVSVETVS